MTESPNLIEGEEWGSEFEMRSPAPVPWVLGDGRGLICDKCSRSARRIDFYSGARHYPTRYPKRLRAGLFCGYHKVMNSYTIDLLDFCRASEKWIPHIHRKLWGPAALDALASRAPNLLKRAHPPGAELSRE